MLVHYADSLKPFLYRIRALIMSTRHSSDKVVIVLTPQQRARVKRERGRDLEEIEVGDARGVLAMQLPGMTPKDVDQIIFRKESMMADDEALDARLAEKAEQDAKDVVEDDAKAEALAKQREEEAMAIAAAIAASFAVEGEAVDAARAAAKKALAVAKAAAAKKKK